MLLLASGEAEHLACLGRGGDFPAHALGHLDDTGNELGIRGEAEFGVGVVGDNVSSLTRGSGYSPSSVNASVSRIPAMFQIIAIGRTPMACPVSQRCLSILVVFR